MAINTEAAAAAEVAAAVGTRTEAAAAAEVAAAVGTRTSMSGCIYMTTSASDTTQGTIVGTSLAGAHRLTRMHGP